MPEPQILLVPLADIEIPEGWNARSGAWHENAADPTSDDGGYEGLKASLAIKGVNDTPVLLRLHPDLESPRPPGWAKRPFKRFMLVDGFRRCRILQELGKAEVRAIVEEMTEFEARRRNIQAQTSHERLKPADLAWAVADLKRLGGPKLTDAELGTLVGISGTYAGTLRRIMADVDDRVTRAWRESAVRVEVSELQRLTVLPKHEHWTKWESLVLDSQTKPHGSTRATAHLRLESRAREFGTTIGTLVRVGIVTRTESIGFRHALSLLTKRTLSDDQIRKLEDVMSDGYMKGLKGP